MVRVAISHLCGKTWHTISYLCWFKCGCYWPACLKKNCLGCLNFWTTNKSLVKVGEPPLDVPFGSVHHLSQPTDGPCQPLPEIINYQGTMVKTCTLLYCTASQDRMQGIRCRRQRLLSTRLFSRIKVSRLPRTFTIKKVLLKIECFCRYGLTTGTFRLWQFYKWKRNWCTMNAVFPFFF